jgi:hypothetical protein
VPLAEGALGFALLPVDVPLQADLPVGRYLEIDRCTFDDLEGAAEEPPMISYSSVSMLQKLRLPRWKRGWEPMVTAIGIFCFRSHYCRWM